MKKKNYLYTTQVDNSITCFENSNECLILENTTANILKRLNKGISVNEIAKTLSAKLSVFIDKTIYFIMDLEKRIYAQKKENVQIRFDWFVSQNCYQLSYSKNEEMIKTVSKKFNNEL